MYIIEHVRNGQEILDLGTHLAMQVYALEHIHLDEGIVFPYRPSASVQIGRYQNTIEEINAPYIEEAGIQVVRRDTGGGAIYMDRNHVNFVFILNESEPKFEDNFNKVYAPAIQGLQKLGASNVERSGRNDLEIDGQKVSGAALTVTKGRLYGGYSLLLDIDFDATEQALRPSQKKIESKGIKSVRRRVTSIRPHLGKEYQDITPEAFEKRMLLEICGVEREEELKYYRLSDEEWAAIDQIVADKYGNWEWNYGTSPRYALNHEGRFAGGTLSVSLAVNKSVIEDIRIYGDFFGTRPIGELEEVLVGTRMDKPALMKALAEVDLTAYLGSITAEELVELILE